MADQARPAPPDDALVDEEDVIAVVESVPGAAAAVSRLNITSLSREDQRARASSPGRS